MHRVRTVLAIAGASLLVTGCLPGPGKGIADRIRDADSPIIREVELSPANGWQGGTHDAVNVFLKDEATDAQALDVWCNVVIPAGADQLPADQVQLLKGFELQPDGGRSGGSRVLRDPVCPPAGSPVPSG